MLKTLKYGFIVLKISWQANGISTLFLLISQIYESTIFPFIQIFLLARLLDLLAANQNLVMSDLYGMIAFYLAASLIRLALKNFLLTQDRVLDFKMNDYIRISISKKLSKLDPATLESFEFQDLLGQMDTSRENIVNFLTRFVALIDSAFKFTVAAIILLPAFPIFIPIILIASLPIIKTLQNYRLATYPFRMEERSRIKRVLDYVLNLLSLDSTSKEIAIFKNGDGLIAKVLHYHKIYMSQFVKANNSTGIYILLAYFIQFVAFVITQFFNLTSVLAGRLTIGQFSLYFQQTLNLALGVDGVLDNYSNASIQTKYVEQYLKLLNYPRTIKLPEQPTSLPEQPIPARMEFKDVSFKYPSTERFILKDFNLTIESGEKIALVGENGAGKTTLIKLILRFYDVTEGEVLINGVNIKDIDLNQWHRQIGALFQDFIKYQFTFKENVFFGDLEKNNNLEALKEAISKSGAESYADDLPEKYDQVLGKMFKGGIDLSGGQWQKLALARAFFRNAPILILDEPTSAIDAKAEYEIFEKVQRLQKDKTVIIISHRFSTVRNADRILVLNEGKIIEEGNHKDLMRKKGIYADLFELQAQGYK